MSDLDNTAPSILRDAVTRSFSEHYSIHIGDIPAWRYQYSVTLTSKHGERTCAVIDRSDVDIDTVARMIDDLREKLIANERRPIEERRRCGYRLSGEDDV